MASFFQNADISGPQDGYQNNVKNIRVRTILIFFNFNKKLQIN